jgi:hypothetical protein
LARHRFGLLPVRSPLLGESRLISTPRGTKMFQFPRFPLLAYGFSKECKGITPCALPHSDIPGSGPAGGSPRLIAAYHVLHRLLAPRHPPCALTCATPAPSRARHTPDLALYTHSVLVKVPDQQTGRSQAFVSPKQRSNGADAPLDRSFRPTNGSVRLFKVRGERHCDEGPKSRPRIPPAGTQAGPGSA